MSASDVLRASAPSEIYSFQAADRDLDICELDPSGLVKDAEAPLPESRVEVIGSDDSSTSERLKLEIGTTCVGLFDALQASPNRSNVKPAPRQ